MGKELVIQKRSSDTKRLESSINSTRNTRHPYESIMMLQQTVGNRAVNHLIQAKLKINQPGDVYEQEADRVADAVVSSNPSHTLQPQVSLLQEGPRSLNESINPFVLTDSEIEKEINLIRKWLLQHPRKSDEHDQILETLNMLEIIMLEKLEMQKNEDEYEFNLLKDHIEIRSVDEYVKMRTKVFGSTEAYWQYAAISDKELSDNEKLRNQIEFRKDKEKQKIFYRWVRKKYEEKNVKNVPQFILVKGKTSNLEDKPEGNDFFNELKSTYGNPFNARPMKSPRYRYILGTLSNHALGTAIDIMPDKNPILDLKDWWYIKKIAGKEFDKSLSRWEEEPELLWKDVTELNDLFVLNISVEADRVKKIIDSLSQDLSDFIFQPEVRGKINDLKRIPKRTKAKRVKDLVDFSSGDPSDSFKFGGEFIYSYLTGKSPYGKSRNLGAFNKGSKLADAKISLLEPMNFEFKNKLYYDAINYWFPHPIDVLFAYHPDLIKWKDGFFTLSWELVKQLHENGFKWGIVFTNPDIHHFELYSRKR